MLKLVTPDSGDEAQRQSLTLLLNRLEDVLNQERAALQSSRHDAHQGFTDRKNQLLRDFIAFQKGLGNPAVAKPLAQRLARVSVQLRHNQQLLGAHVEALKEISQLIAQAILAEESDGTYSARRR
jgi:flagellar biosynthesis/type III secretory pathway chaperone